MYYKRYELQWRINIWFGTAIVGAAFGGLLAFALAKMKGVGGYSGWRWCVHSQVIGINIGS
jgi:MFS family permease